MKAGNRITKLCDSADHEILHIQKQVEQIIKWTFFFLNGIAWCIEKGLRFFFDTVITMIKSFCTIECEKLGAR